jgi:hypothetical protein
VQREPNISARSTLGPKRPPPRKCAHMRQANARTKQTHLDTVDLETKESIIVIHRSVKVISRVNGKRASARGDDHQQPRQAGQTKGRPTGILLLSWFGNAAKGTEDTATVRGLYVGSCSTSAIHTRGRPSTSVLPVILTVVCTYVPADCIQLGRELWKGLHEERFDGDGATRSLSLFFIDGLFR